MDRKSTAGGEVTTGVWQGHIVAKGRVRGVPQVELAWFGAVLVQIYHNDSFVLTVLCIKVKNGKTVIDFKLPKEKWEKEKADAFCYFD